MASERSRPATAPGPEKTGRSWFEGIILGGVPLSTSAFRIAFETSVPYESFLVPRKIRQPIADLGRQGFQDRGGKGSHRNFDHPRGARITISGGMGDDAKHY